MRAQALAAGARIEPGHVDRIVPQADGGFRVRASAREWSARAVILATGVQDVLPPVAWAEAAIACGALRLCAICDAFEATDQRIGVYGPRRTIASHARFLLGYSRRVFLIPTDAAFDPQLAPPEGIEAEQVLPPGGEWQFDGRRCAYRHPDGAITELDTVYPFLGVESEHPLLAGAGTGPERPGETAVDARQMTRVPGLYAIGDMVSGLNQISVAVGQAAIAATHLHRQLPFAPRPLSSSPSARA